MFYGRRPDLVIKELRNICFTDKGGYFPFVIVTTPSFVYVFMTYYRIINTSSLTGVTSGAGTAYPLEHQSSPQVFSGVSVAQSVFFV